MAKLAPIEVRALVKIMDELDYYQILHLERDADAAAIKRAFYATSRAFHPDANRHLEDSLRAECARVSKRATEAYSVLRDPRRRGSYDAHLDEGAGLRLQLAEAKAEAKKASQQAQTLNARTPQGKQFFQKATVALRGDDLAGAIQNLQMALTFEPDNDGMKALLEEFKAKRKAERG